MVINSILCMIYEIKPIRLGIVVLAVFLPLHQRFLLFECDGREHNGVRGVGVDAGTKIIG